MSRITRVASVLGVLAALSLVGSLPVAAQTNIQVNVSWNPPAEGSPVHHYVFQLSIDGAPWTEVASFPEAVTREHKWLTAHACFSTEPAADVGFTVSAWNKASIFTSSKNLPKKLSCRLTTVF